ncbi:MAG: F0F1 ATP synthase subunit B [Candidatus Sungiibacteriota bacterium]
MGELIHNFGVDWRLLLAQAVNFFVLLVVLWKFAYRPILAIFKKRHEDIAKGMTDAREAGEHLAKVEKIGEEKLNVARQDALGIVNQAEALGKQRKEEILAEAAQKGEIVLADAKRHASEEQAKAQEQFFASAEDLMREGIAKVLGRQTPEERDRELIHQVINELKSASKT